MFNTVRLEVKMPLGLDCNEAIPLHHDFSKQRMLLASYNEVAHEHQSHQARSLWQVSEN
ncbi:hypothetical protein [Vibrio tapetis]|uniref:hypothetical protein n=1 Tax=Vibrio tapetis TaxID=52443 RepID=UPI001559C965|nr:hypothetical protein [Vibrio tapetis]